MNCQWFIEVDEDSIIVIEFPETLKFEENQVDCEFDYLLITDPLSGDETKICENGVNKVYSSGNRLSVRFVTDELKVSSGFVLNWSSLLLPIKTDEDFAQTLNRCNESAIEIPEQTKNSPISSDNFTSNGHGFRVGCPARIWRKKLFKILRT